MGLVGYEVYKIQELPDEIRAQFKNHKGFAVKKIFNPVFRVEWEELEGMPSEWLMKALPEDERDE
ncbi:MAG: hypothetical protein HYW26_00680 [Candidatus Aenigmarchaeota archaeon]|nr:hypothetical protein [Candidatus Aenigmarchaeota archaeon]